MSGTHAVVTDGPMPRIHTSDEVRDALSTCPLPDIAKLVTESQQALALQQLNDEVDGLSELLEMARDVADVHGGVVIENCAVARDSVVALLSAAFGSVDHLGNGIPSRLVFDVTPRRDSKGYSSVGSSRGTGEFSLHSDSANFPVPHAFVTLACVTFEAGHGGESLLISADSIARDLVESGRQESVRLLGDPIFPFMSGYRSEDEVVRGPVLYRENDRWCVRYRHQLLVEGGQRLGLDEEHVQALADFEATIAKQELLTEFTLLPGDVWVLDNRRWLHGRRAFSTKANRLLKRCKVYGPGQ